MSLLPSGAIETGGYDINNSLRFRSGASAYLNRTPASTTNRQTWTWSGWVKRGVLGARQHIFISANPVVNTGGQQEFQFAFNSSDQIEITGGVSGVGQDLNLTTTQVFRDPSAWYHFVILMDTTQATSSNRMKFYLNGVQVTAFGTAIYPAQNHNTAVNLINFSHRIGGSGGSYLDAYQAEINFIDGQALTPSSFGETDAVTGVWKPKKYTGTYGTNGFYLPFKNTTAPGFSSYYGSFNGSTQKLTVPASSNFAPGTGDFTVEGWFKTSSIPAYGATVFSQAVSGTNYFLVGIGTGDVSPKNYVNFYATSSGGGTPIYSSTTFEFNTWNHFAVVRQSGVVTVYLNGIGGTPTSNTTDLNNTTYVPTIGQYTHSTANAFSGELSNFRYVKGTAVYTANFTPPTTALTAIANTQLLTLQNSSIVDNSTNALTITNTGSVATTSATVGTYTSFIGDDNSSNNNNWIPNNINYTSSGTTYDAMTDSPTLTSATVANYCVLNATAPYGSSLTLSQGNLRTTCSGAYWASLPGTFLIPSTGKWYWEVTPVVATNMPYDSNISIGITKNISTQYNTGQDQWPGYTTESYGVTNDVSSMYKWTNVTPVAYGSSYTISDVIGVGLDMDAGTLTYYKNGVSQGVAFSGLTGNFVPSLGVNNTGTSAAINFGQRPFAYTPPTGFNRLNTYNLPDSTIKKGNSYMDATLYTGNGSTQSITNAGAFRPDFVWIKRRDGAGQDHVLQDSNRGFGGTTKLASSSTAAENTTGGATGSEWGSVTAANSNGFSITASTSGDQVNKNTWTYVGWQWQAGSSTVTNTSGSISSQVRANTTAGFSIVTYTGTGANATVGHGLGVAPRMIIVKNRTTGAGNGIWRVYHASLGGTQVINLNETTAAASLSTVWNNTNPTSSVFSVGITGSVNDSANNYVAYCWAEIAGFSKFGSYTGNGSTDGPFIYLGFRPKFLMIKVTNAVNEWIIVDSARATYNVIGNYLLASSSGAEGSGFVLVDFLSNGFKMRNSFAGWNGSGENIIYAAFSENPFKNSLAR